MTSYCSPSNGKNLCKRKEKLRLSFHPELTGFIFRVMRVMSRKQTRPLALVPIQSKQDRQGRTFSLFDDQP